MFLRQIHLTQIDFKTNPLRLEFNFLVVANIMSDYKEKLKVRVR